MPPAQVITNSPSESDDEKGQRMRADLKHLGPAYEAFYNAALPSTSTKRFRCTENTRVEVLQNISTWTHGKDGVKIYWLNGMAGTGKTTIAYTICEMLNGGQLGASFFCSRNSPDCRDVNRIIPTIAYQLGHYSEAYREALCSVIKDDPDVAKRDTETQFKHLLIKPLTMAHTKMAGNAVVVIDALDECTDSGGTKDMLELLLRYADHLPLKFFVASRPEPLICGSMESLTGALRSILWLHDIEKSLVEADIKTYLTQALKFSDIPPSDIDRLASLAGCLFIFAATAVRYLTLHDGAVDSHERLQNLLDNRTANGGKRYQELDNLYSTILARALDKDRLEDHEVERRQRVLWTVVCARRSMDPAALSELLDLGNERQIRLAIRSLQSVLHISDESEVVSTLHASFPDFLLDPGRSKGLFCDANDHNSYLATHCFRQMKYLLRFNICGLESSCQLDNEVLDLESRVNAAVSQGLFYACRYWSDHMTRVQPSTTFLRLLNEFMQHQLLFWMEVLSLKGHSSQGEAILTEVVSWLPTSEDFPELRDFVYDARNFATTFAANPCSLSTPHIYVSVLPFTSQESRIWQTYWPRMRGLIQVEGAALGARGRSTLSTWLVGNPVYSIAQSRDGKRIVCGSGKDGLFESDGEVGIWDVSRGTRILRSLGGHTEPVLSASFSPDDTRIASGLQDCTIKIWDASTGWEIAGPLRGHSKAVRSVAFSPDGAQLASGSDDHTIRMWDAYSSTPIGEALKGHRGRVLSVAFSPNGNYLASGSEDCTIRVWNWRTQTTAQEPLSGHSRAVLSVSYSTDGLRLASGSADCTVRVWDTAGCTLLAGPLEGHTKRVSSVAFSPSGSQVVSGSHDYTIRVWDSTTGVLLAGPFNGHTDQVNSVLFTADGTRIISGSNDMTIRVWDAQHRVASATEPSGHSGAIYTVAASPDGRRAASGSDDHMVCVWDMHSGVLIAGPLRGHTDVVHSIAFSPDGAQIVSGSGDRTLRMWDTVTGALIAGPFEGHTGSVSSVAFSFDGSRIASGSYDATILIWHSRTCALVAKPFVSDSTVWSVAFSPDGGRIVSDYNDRAIRTWDANSGTALWTSHAHTSGVTCVAFSPNGSRVVSGSWDRTILVLDASDGTVLHGPFIGHTGYVFSVAFSPDGTCVVSGSEDQTVCVWDVLSGITVAGPFEGHMTTVGSVGFSPDGACIFSGSRDGTVRLWDSATVPHAGAMSFDSLEIRHDGWLTTKEGNTYPAAGGGCEKQWRALTTHFSRSCQGPLRVLWVPPDLRDEFGLLTPSRRIMANARCTGRIDATTLFGVHWMKCYEKPPRFVLS